jgi:hypothetical protein
MLYLEEFAGLWMDTIHRRLLKLNVFHTYFIIKYCINRSIIIRIIVRNFYTLFTTVQHTFPHHMKYGTAGISSVHLADPPNADKVLMIYYFPIVLKKHH